ncbi:tRNA dimethylallyltransferase, mitochondrial [Cystobasidiomycetes sp. EMM_F5]
MVKAIGYKEFDPYFVEIESGNGNSIETAAIFAESLDRMKIGTRRYARRQITWIRNTLLPLIQQSQRSVDGKAPSNSVHLYLLDATGTFHHTLLIASKLMFKTDPGQWDNRVKAKATSMLSGS